MKFFFSAQAHPSKKLTLLLSVLILSIALIGCASAAPTLPANWTPIQTLATGLSPQIRVAASVTTHGTVILWHDTAQVNVLNWRGGDNSGTPKKLPLGHTPRDWNLFSNNDDSLQVVWLDQADLPGEMRLYTAHLAPDLSLQRGPTKISTNDTLDYAALPLISGALLTLWTARTANPVMPLYMQFVDAQGVPRPAVLIARDAAHPALARDPHGNLYAAWLEPQSDHLWAIQYAPLSAALDTAVLSENAPPTPTAISIGLIALEPGRALESFGVGTDATSVYCIWGDANVINGFEGRVMALSFPIGNPAKVMQFMVSDHARWPSIPPIPALPAATLSIGLTASEDAASASGVLFVVSLLPGHIGQIESFNDLSGIPGQTTLIRDRYGSISLFWPTIRADGSTALEESHPLPSP